MGSLSHTSEKKKQDTGPVLPFWLLMKMKGQSQCLGTEALAVTFHAWGILFNCWKFASSQLSGRELNNTAARTLDSPIYLFPLMQSCCLPGPSVAGAALSMGNIFRLHLHLNYYHYIFIAYSHEFHKYIFIHIYPRDSTRSLVKLISTFNKIAGH